MFGKSYFLSKASVATDDAVETTKVSNLVDQADLSTIEAILLSTGINKNDDVFLAEEILPVRSTGFLKPINIEHDPDNIVGVMSETFVLTKSGIRIPDDEAPNTDDFDIGFKGVLYKLIFSNLVDGITESANEQDLFVSVEAWFTSFDYWLGGRIIARNEQTAPILDSHLRANGGTGEFQGSRLGRVLRNLIIGGVGLVEDPANPESIIQSISSTKKDQNIIKNPTINRNILVEDIKISQSTHKENSEVEMDEKVLAELKNLMEAQAAEIKESVKTEIEAVQAENKDLTEKLDKVTEAYETSERDRVIAELGFEADAAEKIREACKDVDLDKLKVVAEAFVNARLADQVEGTEVTADAVAQSVNASDSADNSNDADSADDSDTSDVLDSADASAVDPGVASEQEPVNETVQVSQTIAAALAPALAGRNSKRWNISE